MGVYINYIQNWDEPCIRKYTLYIWTTHAAIKRHEEEENQTRKNADWFFSFQSVYTRYKLSTWNHVSEEENTLEKSFYS